MGILDVKELTAGIIKTKVNMEHLYGIAIRTNGELIALLFV